MAASPVKPDDFKAVISDPSATLCGNFTNTLLKLPVLVWRFMAWALDSDGNLSNEFRRGARATGTLEFSAVTLPENGSRLLCDGRSVSRATYADLNAAMSSDGYPYGAGDGVTTFQLPDFRARFPVGVGTFPSATAVILGQQIGEEKHKLTVDEGSENEAHTHVISRFGTPSGGDQDTQYILHGALNNAKDPTSVGHRVGGGGDATITAALDTLTGEYAVSLSVREKNTDGSNEFAGHNTIPPAIGVFVYIST